MKYFAVLFSGLLVLVAGCSRPPGDGGREAERQRAWETIWVDPQIVTSEPLYTLIYAARIDSLPLVGETSRQAPGAMFDLPEEGCAVTVNLLDQRGAVVRPLIVRKLPEGHYKLTLNQLPAADADLPPGWYTASIAFCGRELRTEIFLQ